MSEKEHIMEETEDPTAWVAGVCEASDSTCPWELLEEVMADPRCDAFGPIHHFIVGAVLLTCYRNAEGGADRNERPRADLAELRQRSSIVPGATCAYWGVCGAAASTGMAHAIIRGNDPLKKEGWSEGQSMVAHISGRDRGNRGAALLQARLTHRGRPGHRNLQWPARLQPTNTR